MTAHRPTSKPTAPRPLPPLSTVGILGGGQLGRMLAGAAARLGFRTHIFAPEKDSPAFDIATAKTVAVYDDETALDAFGAAVDVITYEFENVPVEAAFRLAHHRPVFPDANALSVAQDRLKERIFLNNWDIETAPHATIDSLDALVCESEAFNGPCVLKTRRFGYDGKGQAKLNSPSDAARAWETVAGARSILEAFVPFEMEISVIACRDRYGATAAYAATHNTHVNHILSVSRAPAPIAPETQARARALAVRIVDALDYVGVIGVEMFLVRSKEEGDRLIVNEIAPRVHNSGHWTLDAAVTDQFEQHIRAITGHHLGDTKRTADAEMLNLIGDEAEDLTPFFSEPRVKVHHYGKAEARPGRKMGHVTRLLPLSNGRPNGSISRNG